LCCAEADPVEKDYCFFAVPQKQKAASIGAAFVLISQWQTGDEPVVQCLSGISEGGPTSRATTIAVCD
jgi:hypothetical protein